MATVTGSDVNMLDRQVPEQGRDQLEELVGVLSRGEGSDPMIGRLVAEAVRRLRTPPRIQVAGRARSGRTMVRRALTLLSAVETDPVDEPGTPDPRLDGDIVVYVLAGAPVAADRRALESLPPERAIVVLNKADALGAGWADAVAGAERYSRELRMPVLPLVASLAVRTKAGTVTDTDLAVLRRHVGAGPGLTISPELFTAASAGSDTGEREELLHRWDLYGVSCALAALHHQPDLSGRALLQILHAASAVDPLNRLLHTRYEQVSSRRAGELLDELARLAARAVPGAGGRAREVLSGYLAGDEAHWLGLCAGLAHPEVAHLAAGYPAPAPEDADEAVARATRWRAVAAGDMSPAARRAALRVHNGYVRMWERMSSVGL